MAQNQKIKSKRVLPLVEIENPFQDDELTRYGSDINTIGNKKSRLVPEEQLNECDNGHVKQSPGLFSAFTSIQQNRLTDSVDLRTELPRQNVHKPYHTKKISKESKFKEITRYCLYQTNQTVDNGGYKVDTAPDNLTKHNLAINQNKSRKNCIRFVARDFLTDCRQRLDLNSFKQLLNFLKDLSDPASQQLDPVCLHIGLNDNLNVLDHIYEAIKHDFILCNKFSAFLTSEMALHYNLFTQSSQYEKCIEFLQKLEVST